MTVILIFFCYQSKCLYLRRRESNSNAVLLAFVPREMRVPEGDRQRKKRITEHHLLDLEKTGVPDNPGLFSTYLLL